MRRFLFSIAILACLVGGSFADPGWKDYINPRFGFKFSHPSHLLADPDPPNGAGRILYTRDKEFMIVAWGQFVMEDDTLDKRWAEELEALGPFATYQRKAKDWYVLSGSKSGVEFYHTTHFHEGNAVLLQIEYPHAKNKQYDPWVEKIGKNFVPFLKGDFDRVQK